MNGSLNLGERSAAITSPIFQAAMVGCGMAHQTEWWLWSSLSPRFCRGISWGTLTFDPPAKPRAPGRLHWTVDVRPSLGAAEPPLPRVESAVQRSIIRTGTSFEEDSRKERRGCSETGMSTLLGNKGDEYVYWPTAFCRRSRRH